MKKRATDNPVLAHHHEFNPRISRQILADAIDALHEGFIVFDENDQLAICNQQYLDIFSPISDTWGIGTTLSTIAQDTARHFIGLNDDAEIEEFIQSRIGENEKGSEGRELQFANGRCIRISDAKLANNWTVGIRTDITQLKLIEENLRHSQARFKDYAETAADYFWEFDSDYRYTNISGRFKEVIGLEPEQVIGLNRDEMWALVDPDFKFHTKSAELFINQQAFENTETDWLHTDGSLRMLSVSGRPIYSDSGEFLGFRGSCRNITETHQLATQLSYQATHDGLTGLLNRVEFERQLKFILTHKQKEHHPGALCFLDLDQFKLVNDSCGHAAGDALLCQLAEVLTHHTRQNDFVARLGGDEFGILLDHCHIEDARKAADLIREAISGFRFEWEGATFSVGVSIGIVPLDGSCKDLFDIMRQVDTACYSAKNMGRNQIVVFNPDDNHLSQKQGEIKRVGQIEWALENERFQLYYQPIIAVNHNTPNTYVEFLVRMLDEENNLLAPSAFLPAAERYKLVSKIDRWVAHQVFQWLMENSHRLDNLHLCSINISGQSLGDENFFSFVNSEFNTQNIPTNAICFEITETAAIGNLNNANKFIEHFRNLGCKFALDDFGSGLSSFAYLKNLPVDYLKIDGAFVRDCHENHTNLALVRSIHDIGKVMGKKTVAEFVENGVILDKIREVGIDYAQGYGVGHPAPLKDFFDQQFYQ